MAREVDRLPMLLKKIEHLDSWIADIDRSWRFLPKLWWLCVFALPILFWKGLAAGLFFIFFVVSLVGASAYILGVRRRDYVMEREELRQLTERLSADLPAAKADGN